MFLASHTAPFFWNVLFVVSSFNRCTEPYVLLLHWNKNGWEFQAPLSQENLPFYRERSFRIKSKFTCFFGQKVTGQSSVKSACPWLVILQLDLILHIQNTSSVHYNMMPAIRIMPALTVLIWQQNKPSYILKNLHLCKEIDGRSPTSQCYLGISFLKAQRRKIYFFKNHYYLEFYPKIWQIHILMRNSWTWGKIMKVNHTSDWLCFL